MTITPFGQLVYTYATLIATKLRNGIHRGDEFEKDSLHSQPVRLSRRILAILWGAAKTAANGRFSVRHAAHL